MNGNNAQPVLQIRQVTKTFPGVKALKGVDFTLRKGEVHALMGENGAGKSTLMKIVLGIHQPTSGTMEFKGELYQPHSPTDALNKGISMIHQEISLVPTLSVMENIWLGRETEISGSRLFINKTKQKKATEEYLERVGLNISPTTIVSDLSIAQMQLVEIARAISYHSDVIIMDEPTSALTETEIQKLYSIIEDLSARGTSIVFISHKLDEVYRICDMVTVLRDGTYIKECNLKEINQKELVNLMVGRQLDDMFPKEQISFGGVALEVTGLKREGVFRDISFSVRQGEILGFAGLMGAGRTEIMQAIFGLDKYDEGSIKIKGREVSIHNTATAIKNKMAMVTEDRLRRGALHMLSVKDNISIAYLDELSKYGFINSKKENEEVERIAKALKVKAPSMNHEMALLSGGNQQKVIIAKWMLTEPDILILDEPTRGIDIGAKAEIYRLIGELAKSGKAIIMVSSELPELMGICDRICVIRNGELVKEFLRDEFNEEKIIQSAFGIKEEA